MSCGRHSRTPFSVSTSGRLIKIGSAAIAAKSIDTAPSDGKSIDSELLTKRARAYEQAQDWDAAAADWSRLATDDLAGARRFAEFARRAGMPVLAAQSVTARLAGELVRA